MNDGLPPTRSPSLIGQARSAVRGLRFDRDMRLALGIAALLAAGPLLTIVGAWLLEARVRADIAARAFVVDAGKKDTPLAGLVAQPGVGATMETLARVLPENARLVRVERDAAGGLRVEVAAPDPDRVRAALRAVPDTRALRDAGQRGSDGGMIVAFEDRP